MMLMIHHTSISTTTSATTAKKATISEVSTRWPIQVTETSPGRSAIQPTPAAMTASDARKRTIRIIPTSSLAKCVGRFARELARSGECGLPGLSFSDPLLRRRARRGIELIEIDDRVIDRSVRRFNFNARQYGGRIVARRRIDGADAHKLAGVRFQPLQKTGRSLRPGRFDQRRNQGAQLLRQRRQNFFIGAESLHFLEFRSVWHAAQDCIAQRGRTQRKPRRTVGRLRFG